MRSFERDALLKTLKSIVVRFLVFVNVAALVLGFMPLYTPAVRAETADQQRAGEQAGPGGGRSAADVDKQQSFNGPAQAPIIKPGVQKKAVTRSEKATARMNVMLERLKASQSKVAQSQASQQGQTLQAKPGAQPVKGLEMLPKLTANMIPAPVKGTTPGQPAQSGTAPTGPAATSGKPMIAPEPVNIGGDPAARSPVRPPITPTTAEPTVPGGAGKPMIGPEPVNIGGDPAARSPVRPPITPTTAEPTVPGGAGKPMIAPEPVNIGGDPAARSPVRPPITPITAELKSPVGEGAAPTALQQSPIVGQGAGMPQAGNQPQLAVGNVPTGVGAAQMPIGQPPTGREGESGTIQGPGETSTGMPTGGAQTAQGGQGFLEQKGIQFSKGAGATISASQAVTGQGQPQAEVQSKKESLVVEPAEPLASPPAGAVVIHPDVSETVTKDGVKKTTTTINNSDGSITTIYTEKGGENHNPLVGLGLDDGAYRSETTVYPDGRKMVRSQLPTQVITEKYDATGRLTEEYTLGIDSSVTKKEYLSDGTRITTSEQLGRKVNTIEYSDGTKDIKTYEDGKLVDTFDRNGTRTEYKPDGSTEIRMADGRIGTTSADGKMIEIYDPATDAITTYRSEYVNPPDNAIADAGGDVANDAGNNPIDDAIQKQKVTEEIMTLKKLATDSMQFLEGEQRRVESEKRDDEGKRSLRLECAEYIRDADKSLNTLDAHTSLEAGGLDVARKITARAEAAVDDAARNKAGDSYESVHGNVTIAENVVRTIEQYEGEANRALSGDEPALKSVEDSLKNANAASKALQADVDKKKASMEAAGKLVVQVAEAAKKAEETAKKGGEQAKAAAKEVKDLEAATQKMYDFFKQEYDSAQKEYDTLKAGYSRAKERLSEKKNQYAESWKTLTDAVTQAKERANGLAVQRVKEREDFLDNRYADPKKEKLTEVVDQATGGRTTYRQSYTRTGKKIGKPEMISQTDREAAVF